MELRAEDFGGNFSWGVSAAAYQIEGAHLKHGKGPSIWDEFTRRKGKVHANQNADISCDFYQNYHQDIALMSALNIPNFRFSLAWSRLFPEGVGHVNRAGVDFYKRLIDFCLEVGVEPWITLYHWDLPQALELRGGWTNRDIVAWFCEFVEFCARTFGDRVKRWMVLNEPLVFTGAGYFLGVHAPGRRGLGSFLPALHHAALCQAEGGRILKSVNSGLQVGTTFSFSDIHPASTAEEDILASVRIDALLNRTMIEPLFGLGYPTGDVKVLQRLEPFVKDGDEAKLGFDMDFVGVQCYTREVVAHSFFTPFLQAKIVKADERGVERTLMNWEVFPKSIYNVLHKVAAYRQSPPMIVTENGSAWEDNPQDGHVNDARRREYLQQYLSEVLRAKREGVPVEGYFVWTFTDNFEWAEGYRPRFGLVYVDFPSQKRIVKSSGLWYSKFLSGISADRTNARNRSLIIT